MDLAAEEEAVYQMMDINANLKDELTQVIDQMESQILKIYQKQESKRAAEAELMDQVNGKNQTLKEGQKKYVQLKKSIKTMWQELEIDYSIDQVTKMEDELRLKEAKVAELKGEAKTQTKVITNTGNILETINKTEENKGKAEDLTSHITIAAARYKKLRHETLESSRLIKEQHLHIQRLSKKSKQSAVYIKEEKNRMQKSE